MTKVLKQFKSVCREVNYSYRVIENDTEYKLESFNDDEFYSITWDKNNDNLLLINEACNTIMERY